MRITDANYSLPIVFAIAAHQELPNSANQPIIITGIDSASGDKGDYVVKLNASERMHKEARLRELLGAFIALELELDVVEPVVVDITKEFADSVFGQTFYQKTSSSLGFNVGSKYIKKYTTLDNTISLTSDQERTAQNIFAFDLLIQNNDRNYEKPNMITDGQKLVVLDHELAFGFLFVLSFARNPEPWSFPDADLVWVNKHCLLKRLKGKHYELGAFSDRMNSLNDHFWEKVQQLIPDEWFDSEIFDTIKNHVHSIVVHKEDFIANIKNIIK